MKAIALWDPNKKSKYNFTLENISGYVIFTQLESNVKVNIFIQGLTEGKHGIHIHEKGVSEIFNIADADCCDKLGGHFNIENSWSLTDPHGIIHGQHTGDMCLNITSKNGVASCSYYDDKISLIEGDENCVVNRSVVIHEDEDDCGKGLYSSEEKNIKSLITGNSGSRLACAQIRVIKDENF